MSEVARAGRRPGQNETREQILEAARALFAERGYDGASIRAIAADAGVNPALVHHFFGTKEQVFVAAIGLPLNPAQVLPPLLVDGPRDQLGERIVRLFLSLFEDEASRAPFLALVRSATTHEHAARMMRQFLHRAAFTRIAEATGMPTLRVAAAAGQMMGVALLRYVVRAEPIASAGVEEIVELLAPVMQAYLDGRPLDSAPHPEDI